jgi:hypothetical protein
MSDRREEEEEDGTRPTLVNICGDSSVVLVVISGLPEMVHFVGLDKE